MLVCWPGSPRVSDTADLSYGQLAGNQSLRAIFHLSKLPPQQPGPVQLHLQQEGEPPALSDNQSLVQVIPANTGELQCMKNYYYRLVFISCLSDSQVSPQSNDQGSIPFVMVIKCIDWVIPPSSLSWMIVGKRSFLGGDQCPRTCTRNMCVLGLRFPASHC